MGMIGHKVDLSILHSMTYTWTVRKELLSVLAEMKSEGSLGPKILVRNIMKLLKLLNRLFKEVEVSL
jgi:hypothetical protein